MKTNFGSILFLGLFTASACLADAPKPLPLPAVPPAPVAAYGGQNPDCLEWTNSCVICRRTESQETACSTPGIACQPGGIVCKIMRKKGPE
jgi:hypothetical protein